jgi:flavorubredoxin
MRKPYFTGVLKHGRQQQGRENSIHCSQEFSINVLGGTMFNGVYKAIKISDHVYWVGALDWNIRDFHGYLTRRGSTYNAYLILADKVTLIDTVKAPFRQEMMARIASVVDPRSIRCIVSNHTELDHSGSLPAVIAELRPEEVYASTVGAKALREHFSIAGEITPVKDGQSVSLGNMTLAFLETRMLHWPDSMFSYLADEHLLFSQDAFGMHFCGEERFAEEIDESTLNYEAATYFANIILPYSPLVLKLIERVKASGLSFKIIAPDHGPIWRRPEDIAAIIGNYGVWAAQKPTSKAVVVYATMWRSTELMARAVAEGLAEKGAKVKVMSVDHVHRSDVIYELLDAGAIAVGSPTLNNNMMPQMADIMTYVKGLRPQNLIGAAFGSFGWSGEAAGQLEEILAGMKCDVVSPAIKTRHVPDDTVLAQCRNLGNLMGGRLAQIAGRG